MLRDQSLYSNKILRNLRSPKRQYAKKETQGFESTIGRVLKVCIWFANRLTATYQTDCTNLKVVGLETAPTSAHQRMLKSFRIRRLAMHPVGYSYMKR